jgi:hypothetical protein
VLLRIELRVLSAAKHNYDTERVLDVVTEVPFVVVGLTAVAILLHVYGSITNL